MASNMDGVGTSKMANVLAEQKHDLFVKTYTVAQLVNYFETGGAIQRTNYVAMSIGITEADLSFRKVYEQTDTQLKHVCIDVANGYSRKICGFCKGIRTLYPIL